MTEKIVTSFFLVASIIYLCFAQHLTFGTIESPRSGFLPILAGGTAVVVSLLLIVKQIRSKKSVTNNKVDWSKFSFILIGLLFYITLFNIIGYLISTFIFLLYLFKIADTTGWRLPLLLSATSSAIFYLIFKYYLAVTLP
ncbi:MAG: hypothetical protein K0R78_3311 [Pelosinus sp.]|jgi:hypothetical protein|nr:hypothetical protein [Pelosinus sp.]